MANVEGAIPMAAVPVIPERRSRAVTEIIDVDSLNDDELLRFQRPSQRRRLEGRQDGASPRPSAVEAIVILDSDEEQNASTSTSPGSSPVRIPVSDLLSSAPTATSSTGSRNRIFSPPPPPQDHTVPPVPRIPVQFSGQQSLPMRRLPPPFPSTPPLPDVVRAIERPFEFEITGTPGPARPRRQPPPPPFPAPAPSSHHLPNMGLGGALISQHRRHTAEEHAARRRAARERALERDLAARGNISQQLSQLYRHTLRRLAGANDNQRAPGRWSQMDHDVILAHILAAQDPPEIQFFPPAEARIPEPREPDYHVFYTHPTKPLPGFSADFASSSTPPPSTSAPSSQTIVIVDDSPAASSSSSPPDEATVLLVCAQCLDPLTLNNGKDDLQNRLWGMRCGHIIDGKCMEKLMKPPSIPIAEGKDDLPKEIHVSDRDQTGTTKIENDDNSIRARLRSYHTRDEDPPQSSTLTSLLARPRNIIRQLFGEDDDDPIDLLPRSRRRARGKGGRGKGKGRAVEPVVEATHEWTCPVSGCGKVHVSQLIEGKWTMDKERGAIGIYA